jgi:hypothetical protein
MLVTSYNQNELYTEKEKESEEYLVGCIDLAIAELIKEKDYLRKAYNYYNGIRDAQQFRHLEENFGIGNSTSIEFIPLIRRHVDALVGQHLQNKIKPKVTCKDKPTLNKIERAKQLAIYEGEVNRLKTQFQTNFDFAFATPVDQKTQQVPVDIAVEDELAKLKDNISRNFVSEFEIAAQNVLLHLIQSKAVDMYNKLKIIFLDILIAGQCYYKVKTRHKGETPHIYIYNPFDVFFDKTTVSPYVKTSPRVVVRRWMYKDQILNEYGHFLTKDDIERLMDGMPEGPNSSLMYIVNDSRGLIADTSVAIDPYSVYNNDYKNEQYYNKLNLVPVYEVEWLTTNKNDYKTENGQTIYRMDRYKGVRIGQDIYVDMGKDKDVIRSVENPYECFNSTNGCFYSDRNGKPYSLVLATAILQDKYDILHFHRDNIIANSGVNGDWVDVSNLPTFLGDTPEERLLKFKAYKKQGLALINTAQDGRGANHNTVFNGFKDAVDGNSIQAIQLAITQTEDTCSAITGVFRELLGGIEQTDAVSNVEVGVRQSAVITKQYYQVMDSMTTELLIDAINECKESYRNGMVGSLIMGDKMQKIFSISPEHFCFTDYDVHIADSGDMIRDMQKIEQIVMELIKGGQVDIDVILEGINAESMTEMKEDVLSAIKKKQAENNQIQMLTQQVQQAQQQAKQMQSQLQTLQQQNQVLKNKGLQIEEQAINDDYNVRTQQNTINKDYNDKKIQLDQQRIELEKLEVVEGNRVNNTPNQDFA